MPFSTIFVRNHETGAFLGHFGVWLQPTIPWPTALPRRPIKGTRSWSDVGFIRWGGVGFIASSSWCLITSPWDLEIDSKGEKLTSEAIRKWQKCLWKHLKKIAGKKGKPQKNWHQEYTHFYWRGLWKFHRLQFSTPFSILQHWWCYELSFTFISNKSMIL